MKGIIGLIFVASMLFSEPSCSVVADNDLYKGTIVSNEDRVEDINFTLPIPEPTTIVMDSYFQGCVVFENHKPVQQMEVILGGNGWDINTTTSDFGCWEIQVPSDTNFTIKIMNPLTNELSSFDGHITSRGIGELTTDKETMTNYNLFAGANFKPDINVTKFEYLGVGLFKFTPTEAGKPHNGVWVELDTKEGVEYQMMINTSKKVNIYFYDTYTETSLRNMAQITGVNKLVPIDVFKAISKNSTFYFAPQGAGENLVSVSIKEAE